MNPPEPGQGQGSSWGHQPRWLPPAPGHGGIKGRWQRAGCPRFVPAPHYTLQVGSRARRTRGFSFSLRLFLVAVDGPEALDEAGGATAWVLEPGISLRSKRLPDGFGWSSGGDALVPVSVDVVAGG